MSKFTLGQSEASSVTVDIDVLLRTRMLVQANSGGGKSYVLRRILEQSYGKVQQIVIDLEGEFFTLREKYDYILVGKGGEVAANVRYAGQIAEKVLELGLSSIIDLYELKHYDRIKFVKVFLDAMVNVRKELWHPCLIIIDEAHVFAPEKGESEALGSVIDICTRGRKRSFCAILATQRLSKLHKDAAAECNNKLIGRSGLDVDMKRASEELGFTTKTDMLSLRDLSPGEFFSFGPALTQQVTRLKVGAVTTTHPDIGTKAAVLPPPPKEKVRHILSQLEHLPKDAEEKAQTLEAMKLRIRELERSQRAQPKQVDKAAISRAMERAKQEANRENAARIKSLESTVAKQQAAMKRAADTLVGVAIDLPKPAPIQFPRTPEPIRRVAPSIPQRRPSPVLTGEEVKIGHGAKRMLAALIQWHPNGMQEGQMRSHAGLKRSGTYGTYKSQLRVSGFIEERDGLLYATDAGIDYFGHDVPPAPTSTDEVLTVWLPKLGFGAQRMLKVLVDRMGESMTDDELQIEAGMGNSGTYGTYKSQLRTANLIVVGRGIVAANKDTLFL